jgi:predicted membrane chloride channel (bestrophin family)
VFLLLFYAFLWAYPECAYFIKENACNDRPSSRTLVLPCFSLARIYLACHFSTLGIGYRIRACYTQGFGLQLSVGTFSLIGLALAIFLGSRNSSSYERYWEARKLWGALLISARSLQTQAMSMTSLPADHPELHEFS